MGHPVCISNSPGSDMEGTVEVGVEALEEDEDGFLSAASASLMSRLPEGLRSFSSRNCEVKPKWSHSRQAYIDYLRTRIIHTIQDDCRRSRKERMCQRKKKILQ